MRTTLIILTAYLLNSCGTTYIPVFHGYGVYEHNSIPNDAEVYPIAEVELQIQAKKIYLDDIHSNESFGVHYYVQYGVKEKPVTVEWKVIGPADPGNPGNTEMQPIQHSFTKKIITQKEYYQSFHFSDESEKVPGTWKFELYVKEKKIASWSFELIAGSCPENEDCYTELVFSPDVGPNFPGGKEAMNKFVKENIVYPKEAADQYLQDRVVVSFKINKDGTISDIKIIQGKYPILNQAAIDVVTKMPVWIPGQLNGKNVLTSYTLPIDFVVLE